MNEIDHIRKLLADTKAGEKGWRKALATSEGSFSRTLAEKNLRRLAAFRETLLSQLNAADAPPPSEADAAATHGLLAEGRSGSASERKFA